MQVKEYVSSQCSKILNDGKSTLQDCIIAKEYRGAKYYKQGVVVPALVLARSVGLKGVLFVVFVYLSVAESNCV